jgi:hypothetical protein
MARHLLGQANKMKIKTKVKAGAMNHNQSGLRIKTKIKAGDGSAGW